MIPPPPPPRSFRLPPPPPPPPPRPWYGDEPEIVPISPDLSRFDLEAAIWVHGGYPQVPWPEAVRELLRKCKATPFGQINAAAINILDRELPTDFDLTFDRSKGRFDKSANDNQFLKFKIKGIK